MDKVIVTSIPIILVLLIPTTVDGKTFDNGNYRFDFPNGCKMEKTENRFSTANAELDCKGDAGFQFESDRETSNTLLTGSDDDLIESMRSTIERNYENVDVVESATDKYIINNKTAPYVIASYDQEYTNFLGLPAESEPFVLMYIIIDIGGEKMLVQYRNDEDSFDKDLPMAEKIFQSVEGLGNRTALAQTVEETDTDTDTYSSSKYPNIARLCNNPDEDSTGLYSKDLCDLLLK